MPKYSVNTCDCYFLEGFEKKKINNAKLNNQRVVWALGKNVTNSYNGIVIRKSVRVLNLCADKSVLLLVLVYLFTSGKGLLQ